MSEVGGVTPAAEPVAVADLDQVVSKVASRADAWSRVGPAERAAILDQVIADTARVADGWLRAACAAKGYDPGSAEGGEEAFSGIGTLLRLARALRTSMIDLATVGRPRYAGPVAHRAGDRLSIQVAPDGAFDRILFPGLRAEVWMAPGVTEEEVRATQAAAYRDPRGHAGVAVVLAAGNVASLGPRDALSQLFVDGRVVVLKANPVNAYLVPFWEEALAALVVPGYLRIVTGGSAVGAHLVAHSRVDGVHLTGSAATHDAIVFGPGPEGERRKAANEPLLATPVTCELGNVSPVIVVPGAWSQRELSYQARHVATMLANNAGFNCLAPRVLVTAAAWPQREAFLDELEGVLASLPARRAYYPGAFARRDRFVAAHPDARVLGAPGADDTMGWTLIRDVDTAQTEDISFTTESFCALMSETALAADSAASFVAAAVDFCNDVLWGTLSATILVDPRTGRDPAVAGALERAVADLRYGSIGVNAWHAMSFVLGTTVWGAHPGHTAADIQSGRGFVGNALLFAQPERSVVRGPFTSRPDPLWFATSQRSGPGLRRLVDFESQPSWGRLPRLALAALRP